MSLMPTLIAAVVAMVGVFINPQTKLRTMREKILVDKKNETMKEVHSIPEKNSGSLGC